MKILKVLSVFSFQKSSIKKIYTYYNYLLKYGSTLRSDRGRPSFHNQINFFLKSSKSRVCSRSQLTRPLFICVHAPLLRSVYLYFIVYFSIFQSDALVINCYVLYCQFFTIIHLITFPNEKCVVINSLFIICLVRPEY